MEEIRFEYKPTIRDNIICTFLFLSRSTFQVIVGSLFPLAGIFALVVAVNRYGSPRATDYLAALSSILFIPFLLLTTIGISRFRTRGTDLTQHYLVDKNGITISAMYMNMEIKWDAIQTARETSNHLILIYKIAGGLILPKYALAEAGVITNIKRVIAENLGSRARFKNDSPQPVTA